MDVGTRVWVHEPSDPLVWVSAQVLAVHRSSVSTEKPAAVTLQLLASDRIVETALSFSSSPSGAECCNVLLQNHDHELDQSDLVALPHLHEASILHALRLRYARDAIYTRIGEILISINPFKKLPALYTRDTVMQYAPDKDETVRDPHLFAIARAAYVDVVRNGRNQSILISGESGAGKTEATKIMMQYFAETCPATATAPTSPTTTFSIETQVLQSNPILEAFGNARTVRNDNSSRFGKFIELQFDARHAIVGARIRTYLLEKIRVICQAPHERNFHVFYELLAAVSSSSSSSSPPGTPLAIAAAAPAWKLRHASDFRILNQSGCLTRRDGVNDATQFVRTHRAMQQIGLRDDEIVDVFSVVAALLHLGNVAFSERTDSESVVAAGNEPFGTAALLLRVAPAPLAFAMTKRTLTTATETLTVALDAAQAEHTRNALVMECYRLLFAWLVGKINSKIHYDAKETVVDCIGLLDIFGFEDMAVNSFEQLCINYANEALQHQFNAFVFDDEQALYAREEIPWAFVAFPNNKACLELFEKKPLGLFSLCDQECLFPQGTDRALLAKLYAEFDHQQKQNHKTPKSPHPHFAAPASGWQRQSHFVVAHYAGRVSYAVDGFLAKNKDAFCETAASLLATSSNALVQSLSRAATTATGSHLPPPPPGETRAKTHKATSLAAVSVGTQFKLQLNDLLDRIRATAPHYVRCMKPNDASHSDAFVAPRVLEQLRCGGVLEAVRVARAGFPVRMAHAHFLARYQRVLLYRAAAPIPNDKRPLLECCLARLKMLVPSAATSVSLGKTRVFFRRVPYEQIERLRIETTTNAATRIQKTLRGYRVRHAFHTLRSAVLRLQAQWRGARARALATLLNETRAVTLLQRHTRGWLAVRRFTCFRLSVLVCQSHWRRLQAQRLVQTKRHARAANRIATFWRCHHLRRQYNSLWRSTLALQCAVRRRDAKRRLLALRVESRNVSKLQHANLQLQTELASLRMALLAMQAQSTGQTPFPNVQIPIAPAVAAQLQMPKPSLLLARALDKTLDIQPVELYDAASTMTISPSPESDPATSTRTPIKPSPESDTASSITKPRSQLAVDLSSPGRVTLQAPHSVLPSSGPFFSGASTAASSSTTKADMFTRRRSRSSQSLATTSNTNQRWQHQQDALDAKVRQLRDELKEAAQASNPEHEQDEIVKRFVAAQLRQAALSSPQRPRLTVRQSGNFELVLPEDCDNNNNSAVDDADNDTPEMEVPQRPLASGAAHFKTRSSSSSSNKGLVGMAPPLTACAPHSRFAWGTNGSSETMPLAPLSARPASHTGLSLCGATRFFGAGDATERSVSAWSSSAFSLVGGSVPRWCKAAQCHACQCKFTFLIRRHHCRSCGHSFCFEHSTRRLLLRELGYVDEPQRVCDDCFEWRAMEAMRASQMQSQYGQERRTAVRPADLLARVASSLSLASTARDSDLTIG